MTKIVIYSMLCVLQTTVVNVLGKYDHGWVVSIRETSYQKSRGKIYDNLAL